MIGLEFRVSPVTGGQVGIYRTSDRTIQLFGQYSLLRQSNAPVSVDAVLAVEGTNNFRDEYSPAVGAIVSRTVGDRLTFSTTGTPTPAWLSRSASAVTRSS